MIKNAYKIVSHSAEKSDARINAERQRHKRSEATPKDKEYRASGGV